MDLGKFQQKSLFRSQRRRDTHRMFCQIAHKNKIEKIGDKAIYFRSHRGHLEESIQTLKGFDSLEELKVYLIEKYDIPEDAPGAFEVEEYGKDARLDTKKIQIVKFDGMPLGFIDILKDKKPKKEKKDV